MLEAREHLRTLRFLQTDTVEWSGAIKPPAWVEASKKRGRQYAQQVRTYPELVREFRVFVERVGLERRTGTSPGSIIIGIDELDKIGSSEDAERFLNDIKAVFGVMNCHYVVSISEDALAAFERRAFALRSAFDSAFDMVIAVPRMTIDEVRRLLARRLVILPEPVLALCHSLAAGLPRDVIRVVRSLLDAHQIAVDQLQVQRQAHTEGALVAGGLLSRVPLRQLAAELIQDDLRAMTDGQTAALSRLRCAGSDTILSWVGDAGRTPVDAAALLRLCQSAPDVDDGRLAPDAGAADHVDTIMAARMVRQYRAYLYYVATLVDVFCTDAERFATSMENNRFPVETLAQARAHLAVDHARSWRSIDAFRDGWGLAPGERERLRSADPAANNGRTAGADGARAELTTQRADRIAEADCRAPEPSEAWDDVPRCRGEHLTIRSLASPPRCYRPLMSTVETRMIWVGDDWAEDHHDVELLGEDGRRLARVRLPEGLDGITRLHALIAEHMPVSWAELEPAEAAGRVRIGIETDRGTWVQALLAAGYRVYAINPMSVARYRERHSTSGAKSDAADAHILAEIVRLDHTHHRQVAGDSPAAEAVKLVARAHQSLIWDRTRQVLRLRSSLREFFPAALAAFDDLAAGEALELLDRAPDPDRAARLSRTTIVAALRRAGRRDLDAKATAIQQALRAEQLRQPKPVQNAYAAIVSSQVQLINILNIEIAELGQVVANHFGRHRDAERYLSQPGLGPVLGARILGEFGDDPHRYTDAKARRNYAGTSPITRASGNRRMVLARYARNRRLADAVHQWAFCAMRGSPGARTYYQTLRERGTGHQAALRQLANRLVGILHGCLKTGTTYDEHTAWGHL